VHLAVVAVLGQRSEGQGLGVSVVGEPQHVRVARRNLLSELPMVAEQFGLLVLHGGTSPVVPILSGY
jgi:hypothetical protein